MPPAGTVFCVHAFVPLVACDRLQQPTWIVPGVSGAR